MIKKLSNTGKSIARFGSSQQSKLKANGEPRKSTPRPITLPKIKKDKDQ